jgi:hypothetical protein
VETVLQPGQFDPLGVDCGNHFIQLFLGRDHDPAGSNYLVFLQQLFADFTKLLNGGPQVFNPVGAAGDVLAYFVNDEYEGLIIVPLIVTKRCDLA